MHAAVVSPTVTRRHVALVYDAPVTQDEGPSASVPPPADSVREMASEEFLFHLYRGAEMLQDDRVHEAKEELEAALDLQPRDPKGQDLLAVVYFRIGLYPRAIQIYEVLLRDNPRDTSLMINLALCYLKTGQSPAARSVLEELVQLVPEHRRAWGYLGLAYERLGDFEKAEQSFERAGHAAMARRMAQMRPQNSLPPPSETEPNRAEQAAIRATAAVAFQELDSGELSFALAEPAMRRTESGTWRAVEIGAAVRTSPSVPPPPPAAAPAPAAHASEPAASPAPMRPPRPFGDVVRDGHLVPAQTDTVTMHPSGLVLVQPSDSELAVRMGAVRSYSGTLQTSILERQTRTPSSEPFGGLGAPLMRMKHGGPVLIGPRAAHRLVPVQLAGDIVFLREDVVLGFELRLTYENGRLTFGEGETLAVVQFRGEGAVLLELLDPIVALDVTSRRSVVVRRESIVGWQGRLLPRALPMSEAPSGQRGLLSFSGDGAVLLSGR